MGFSGSIEGFQALLSAQSTADLAAAAAAEIVAVAARSNSFTSDFIESGPTASRSGETQFSPYSSAAGLVLTLTGAVTPIVMMIAGTKHSITGAKNVTLIDNSLNFVYYDSDTDTLGTTIYPPVFSRETPASPAATQPWFDMNTGLMKFYSGSAWVTKNRIFLGIWDVLGTVIDTAYFAYPIGWTVRTIIDNFGDGMDGAAVYSAANARWEDTAGAALTNVGGKWSVSGSTLTLLRNFKFAAVWYQAAATIISGTDGNQNSFAHKFAGPLIGFNAGVFRALYWRPHANALQHGGAARTTVGAGNNPDTGAAGALVAGGCGGSASGGGDGTNIGGHGAYDPNTDSQATGAQYPHITAAFNGVLPAGATTAGQTGVAAVEFANLSVDSGKNIRLPGECSPGAGGGALKQSGGSTASGKGGDGVRGGGIVDIYAMEIRDVAGFLMQAPGEAGNNGAKGVATNAAGDIAGGGGGSAGGGGGTIVVIYGPGGRAAAGTISAPGGLGGSGGAGEVYNGTPSATSNGGNGSPGAAGVAIVDKFR